MQYFFICLLLLPWMLKANSRVENLLTPYKYYLDHGTYDGADWSDFDKLPESRYVTFKAAFEYFEEHGGKTVVELGTTRSFTHGGLPGCNLDDTSYWTPDHPENWDWGAGFFTRMAAICLSDLSPQMTTLDLIPEHIERCKTMTADYSDIISYQVSASEDFLNKCDYPEGIDLLYLDTGDMTPIEPTANLQLREAIIIVERNLISEGGLILIDDVRNQTPKKFGDTSGLGKSKYALPYLLDHGFEIVLDEYQVLLRKK